MGLFGYFRKKKEVSEKKAEEVQKQQITKLKRNIYQQRIDYLKDKLEHLKQRHEELILEDQIQDLEEDLEGSEDDENENLPIPTSEDGLLNNLMSLGVQAMTHRNLSKQTTLPPQSQTHPPTGKRAYSDAEISEIVSRTPKDTLDKLKNLDNNFLGNVIRQQYPDADDTSIEKAKLLIKNQ